MKKNKAQKTSLSTETLKNICSRVHYLTTQMINQANHRSDKVKGDPKVGGHPAACASSLHIMGALHLLVKSGFDYIANKPHAAPVDHSYNYILDLFLKDDLSRLTIEEANQAMLGLRAFSKAGEYVFQSYHSAFDCDHHGFLPSGTVGIPPVNAGYLAHAYTFCREHGFEVPDAHFWAVLGDSEFREGSVFECVPEFAEREIGNLTWIVDYNRQSLDGHRINNKDIMNGTDDKRIERTMLANGWDVIQVKHGKKREALFAQAGGDIFKKFIQDDLQDYELQALLMLENPEELKKFIVKEHSQIKKFVESIPAQVFFEALRDFGGHDLEVLAGAMEQSKLNKRKPTLIIAHTLKGWGLRSAASPGNHSSLPDEDEVLDLQKKQGLKELFGRFESQTTEAKFCAERGNELLEDIKAEAALRNKNRSYFDKRFNEFGGLPVSLGINLKMASYPHTQWMLGQCTAKLTRIANTNEQEKALPADEKAWKLPGELLVSMAPDVGTSTNLNPAMDGKIFGANHIADYEAEFGVKDKKLPDLVPGEDKSDRFIRFEIAEGNVTSCVGSYGKIREQLGIPIIPLMTVYDFFVKRAHDQFFYNLYWKSSFILVGTPSGVTLSPEGAQHGWKSDFQIPNQITWEPFFCLELEWILADAMKRHLTYDNDGRTGVFIRGVTRGLDQKIFSTLLKRQKRFKVGLDSQSPLSVKTYAVAGAVDESTIESIPEAEMFEQIRLEVLKGAYYLNDFRSYAGYEPGDNVVNIISMGSVSTEALCASEVLLERGIYANVIIVTSPDLLTGNIASQNSYDYLRNSLGIDGSLHLNPIPNGGSIGPEIMTLAGRRVPIVSVHDGEPGLLDNLGSIVGVRHECLAVRKHSKCGRPEDIYRYHHLDSDSIVEAAGKVLSETALEQIKLGTNVLREVAGLTRIDQQKNWKDLWPQVAQGTTGHARDDH
jgi:pyruvate dehydrogenase E1 component